MFPVKRFGRPTALSVEDGQDARTHPVEGPVLIPAAGDYTFAKPLLRKPLPMVLLSRCIRTLPLPAVVTDNVASAFLGMSQPLPGIFSITFSPS